jgi:hypothetical protein
MQRSELRVSLTLSLTLTQPLPDSLSQSSCISPALLEEMAAMKERFQHDHVAESSAEYVLVKMLNVLWAAGPFGEDHRLRSRDDVHVVSRHVLTGEKDWLFRKQSQIITVALCEQKLEPPR